MKNKKGEYKNIWKIVKNEAKQLLYSRKWRNETKMITIDYRSPLFATYVCRYAYLWLSKCVNMSKVVREIFREKKKSAFITKNFALFTCFITSKKSALDFKAPFAKKSWSFFKNNQHFQIIFQDDQYFKYFIKLTMFQTKKIVGKWSSQYEWHMLSNFIQMMPLWVALSPVASAYRRCHCKWCMHASSRSMRHRLWLLLYLGFL